MRKFLCNILFALTVAVTSCTPAAVTPAQEAPTPPAGRWVIRVDVSAHPYYNWWDQDSYATVEECEFARNHDPSFAADRDSFVEYEYTQHGPETVITFYCWTPTAPGRDI